MIDDRFASYSKRVYDFCVVRSSETTADEGYQREHACLDDNPAIMGYGSDRVLFYGARQPHGLCRKRRYIQPDAAEGYSGSDNLGYFHDFYGVDFQR